MANEQRPGSIGADFARHIARNLSEISEDVKLPDAEARGFARDCLKNKEEYFSTVLDTYPQLDHDINDWLKYSWYGPKRFGTMAPVFWLTYFQKYNSVLNGELNKGEIDKTDRDILNRRHLEERRIHKPEMSDEEFEMELSTYVMRADKRSHRARLADRMRDIVAEFKDLDVFSPIFKYDSESETIKDSSVAKIFKELRALDIENLTKSEIYEQMHVWVDTLSSLHSISDRYRQGQ